MASTITNFSNAINVNYPVPGQDNDSQGFRTNFSKIQSALNVAGDEITKIQLNSVNLNGQNDFGNNIIKKAAFLNCSDVSYTGTPVNGIISVDLNNGGYQRFTISSTGTYNINIVGESYPPSGYCGTVRLELERAVGNVTVNFIGENTQITGRTDKSVKYDSIGTCVWDVWTPDEGTTLIANEVGGSSGVVTLRQFTLQELSNWASESPVSTGTLVYLSNSLAYYNGTGWFTLTGTLAVLPEPSTGSGSAPEPEPSDYWVFDGTTCVLNGFAGVGTPIYSTEVECQSANGL